MIEVFKKVKSGWMFFQMHSSILQKQDIKKIELYAIILRGVVLTPKNVADAEAYIDVISELSLSEFILALKIYNPKSKKLIKMMKSLQKNKK